jgi:hypothetical protein
VRSCSTTSRAARSRGRPAEAERTAASQGEMGEGGAVEDIAIPQCRTRMKEPSENTVAGRLAVNREATFRRPVGRAGDDPTGWRLQACDHSYCTYFRSTILLQTHFHQSHRRFFHFSSGKRAVFASVVTVRSTVPSSSPPPGWRNGSAFGSCPEGQSINTTTWINTRVQTFLASRGCAVVAVLLCGVQVRI